MELKQVKLSWESHRPLLSNQSCQIRAVIFKKWWSCHCMSHACMKSQNYNEMTMKEIMSSFYHSISRLMLSSTH